MVLLLMLLVLWPIWRDWQYMARKGLLVEQRVYLLVVIMAVGIIALFTLHLGPPPGLVLGQWLEPLAKPFTE